jgi:prolipoprotein diacylglyceryl transferase
MTAPDPIAFTLFGLSVRWYGILMAAAILTGGFVMYRRAPKHGIRQDDVIDILLVAVPCGIIGARLYYVLFEWSYYSQDLAQIFNLRGGGLAVHGSLIGGFLGAWLVCRHKKISFADGLDMTVAGIALAQAIGRWGNFFNGEAHGGPTDLPWGIMVDGVRVHPTFLYESIWCLLLFFLLLYLDNHRKFIGQIFLSYGFLYSLERFFVEGLRTDSLMIGQFRQAQVLSAAVMLACAVSYVILLNRKPNKNSVNAMEDKSK